MSHILDVGRPHAESTQGPADVCEFLQKRGETGRWLCLASDAVPEGMNPDIYVSVWAFNFVILFGTD
jgi:hypothetical protein